MRGGYAATPQRSAKAKTGALDQAMVGLQAAERAITELQGVIAVRCSTELCTYIVTNTTGPGTLPCACRGLTLLQTHNAEPETSLQAFLQLTSKFCKLMIRFAKAASP